MSSTACLLRLCLAASLLALLLHTARGMPASQPEVDVISDLVGSAGQGRQLAKRRFSFNADLELLADRLRAIRRREEIRDGINLLKTIGKRDLSNAGLGRQEEEEEERRRRAANSEQSSALALRRMLKSVL